MILESECSAAINRCRVRARNDGRDRMQTEIETFVQSLAATISGVMDLSDINRALTDTKLSIVAIGDSMLNISTDEAALLQKIADLESQLSGGTVISASDMAGLKSDTASLRASLTAAAASLKGIADAVPDA